MRCHTSARIPGERNTHACAYSRDGACGVFLSQSRVLFPKCLPSVRLSGVKCCKTVVWIDRLGWTSHWGPAEVRGQDTSGVLGVYETLLASRDATRIVSRLWMNHRCLWCGGDGGGLFHSSWKCVMFLIPPHTYHMYGQPVVEPTTDIPTVSQ